MAHLLIVDDEDLTVKRLQAAVDWESLGISQVYTAFSMVQAQKVFWRGADRHHALRH